MPYDHTDTTPIFPPEGDEELVFPNKYDKAYETVRPSCHFDMRKIDIFTQGSVSGTLSEETIESKFTKVGVTYDYFSDYDKWKHVEALPPYPIELGPGNAVPPPSMFTEKHQSYGFNYSSKMGIGNRKYNWLSHTDLDLLKFKKIKDNVRKPILEKVKEAKQRQDILSACRIQKFFKALSEETGEPEPNFPEIKFYTPDTECGYIDCPDKEIIVDCFAEVPEGGCPEGDDECQDWSCSKLAEVINNIPLECELIEDVLGEEYKGSDLSRYWWEGWTEEEGGVSATKEMLDAASLSNKDSETILPVGFQGTTFSIPTTGTDAKPPYQDIIGAFNCGTDGSDEEILLDPEETYGDILKNVVKRLEPQHPFYGAFGGYTANVCGCLEVPKDAQEITLPDYIEKCNFPNFGEKYPEYLQYVASEDVRYWNTPNETPLYRKAQMQLLFSSEIEIETPGDFNIKVGSIIQALFPTAVNSEVPDGIETKENQLNGKWLVVKIKHIFQNPSLHKMRLTCVRDSKYI